MVEVHKSVCRPESGAQLLPRHDLPRALQQHGKDLKRLFLEFHLRAISAQFACPQVCFEDAEVNHPRSVIRSYCHAFPRRQQSSTIDASSFLPVIV